MNVSSTGSVGGWYEFAEEPEVETAKVERREASAEGGATRSLAFASSSFGAAALRSELASFEPTAAHRLDLTGPIGFEDGALVGEPAELQAAMRFFNDYIASFGPRATPSFSEAEIARVGEPGFPDPASETDRAIVEKLRWEIESYQSEIGFENPDGLIAVDGRTHNAMNAAWPAIAVARREVEAMKRVEGGYSEPRLATDVVTRKKTLRTTDLPTRDHPVGHPVGGAHKNPIQDDDDAILGRPDEIDMGDVGHGIMTHDPVEVILNEGTEDEVIVPASQARRLYLQLNGYNSFGGNVRELAEQHLMPDGTGLIGDFDAESYQAFYRASALKELEAMGLTEEQFYAVMNDAYAVRAEMDDAGIEPMEIVTVRFDGYDLAQAQDQRTGLTGETVVQTRATDVTLGDLAAATGDPSEAYWWKGQLAATQRYLADHHPGITESDVTSLGRTYQENVQKALQDAIEDGPEELARYARLIQLKALLEAHETHYLDDGAREYAEDIIEHLGGGDPAEAMKRLDEEIEALAADPVVEEAMQEVLDETRVELQGPRAEMAGKAAAQKDYLRSEAFQDRLDLVDDPAERQRVVSEELQRLAAFDPEGAQEVAAHLVAREVAENPVRGLQQLDDEELVRSAEEVLAGLAAQEGIELTPEELAEGAQVLAEVLRTLPPDAGMPELRNALALSTGFARRFPTSLIPALDKAGLGAFTSGWLAASLFERNVDGVSWDPSTAEFWMNVRDVAALTGAVASTADMLSIGLTGAEATLTTLGRVAGGLGGLAALVAAPLQAYGAYEDYARGDTAGMVFKGLGAASSVAAGIAGIAILAGSTGVGAPVALVAGAVALGAWIADEAFGEPDEAAYIELQELGLID